MALAAPTRVTTSHLAALMVPSSPGMTPLVFVNYICVTVQKTAMAILSQIAPQKLWIVTPGALRVINFSTIFMLVYCFMFANIHIK